MSSNTPKRRRPFLMGCLLGFISGFLSFLPLLYVGGLLFRDTIANMAASHLKPPSITHGLTAPYDWAITAPDGSEFPMESTRGKAVFLHFWGPDCPGCQAETASLNTFYEQVRDDERIAFICVALDEFDKVTAMVDAGKVLFPAYTFDGARPAPYAQKSIPVTYLIQPDGQIAFKHEGGAKWDDEGPVNFLRSLAAQAE